MPDSQQNLDPTPIRSIEYAPKPPTGAFDEMHHQFRRWARDTFTRENIISNLKTLAWVVPLTFLIWVYAEREQIATYKDEPLPFELVSVDPNRIVTLNRNQDKNLIVDLQGPQARVQDVLQKIRGGQNEIPRGIRLEIDPSLSPNKEHEVNAVALLRSQKIFSDYGITVVGCQPARLLVSIDEVIEKDAKIVAPPSVKNLEPSSSFDPPMVRVRGPKTKLDEVAAQNNGQLVVYADIPPEVLRQPGHRDLPDVSIQRPPSLTDDRISLVNTSKVKASLDVRAADVTDTLDSITITLNIPDALLDKISSGALKVDKSVYRPFLPNVHVIGPQQVIEAMKRPEFAPRPRALIDVTDSDVGEIKQKPLTFLDLPDGVKISDEDKKRTVPFRLIERGATD